MADEFDIIAKMDPMARRAKAAVEAIEKAIATGDRDSLAAHLEQAENALSTRVEAQRLIAASDEANRNKPKKEP